MNIDKLHGESFGFLIGVIFFDDLYLRGFERLLRETEIDEQLFERTKYAKEQAEDNAEAWIQSKRDWCLELDDDVVFYTQTGIKRI